MGLLRHLIWIVVVAIVAELVLHSLGLPTVLEFLYFFLQIFSLPAK